MHAPLPFLCMHLCPVILMMSSIYIGHHPVATEQAATAYICMHTEHDQVVCCAQVWPPSGRLPWRRARTRTRLCRRHAPRCHLYLAMLWLRRHVAQMLMRMSMLRSPCELLLVLPQGEIPAISELSAPWGKKPYTAGEADAAHAPAKFSADFSPLKDIMSAPVMT